VSAAQEKVRVSKRTAVEAKKWKALLHFALRRCTSVDLTVVIDESQLLASV
jgi:hypothetical protein